MSINQLYSEELDINEVYRSLLGLDYQVKQKKEIKKNASHLVERTILSCNNERQNIIDPNDEWTEQEIVHLCECLLNRNINILSDICSMYWGSSDFKSAFHWFLSDSSNAFSFKFICHHLGYDYNKKLDEALSIYIEKAKQNGSLDI